MTDPTAPETPRTEEDDRTEGDIAAYAAWRRDPNRVTSDAVNAYPEREAGSTDALRAALFSYPFHVALKGTLEKWGLAEGPHWDSLEAFIDDIAAALAASDAGEAWVESVVGEPGMYASDAGPLDHGYAPRPKWAGTCPRCGAAAGTDCAVLSDAGLAGIDVERLAHALNDMTEGDSPDLWWDVDMGVWYATPSIHDLAEKIAAEYDRLSRESDR
jgi:hypothetical protein